MEEKLKNWSERFLLLEEKLVNTDNKIDDLNKELLY